MKEETTSSRPRKITICQTCNGWLVVSGELERAEEPDKLLKRCWSFNNLNEAVAHIRDTINGWQRVPHIK
jgi:hypothetical protein